MILVPSAEACVQHMRVCDLADGEFLCRRGEPGEFVAVVESGELQVLGAREAGEVGGAHFEDEEDDTPTIAAIAAGKARHIE